MRRLTCLLTLPVALASGAVVAQNADYAAVVLADAPVAYYRFEQGGTTAVDSSGNGNNGTVVNGPQVTQGPPGLGGALAFDGINDHVSTPRTVAGNFTLELWINTTASSLSGGQAFEGNGLLWSDVGGGANDFVLAFLNNRAAFFTGDPETTVIGTSNVNTGSWRHVVATRTQGGDKQVWVDGVLQASGPGGSALLTANPLIVIGANTLDSRYFNGRIDEVAYYDRVLTPTQIRTHYAAGIAAGSVAVPASTPSLLALLAALLLGAGALALRVRRA